MSVRRSGQSSFAESLVHRSGGANGALARIAAMVDWTPIERLVAPLRSEVGAPGYPPLVMVKALLLQQWYDLSDPGLEEALADRLSFRAFLGVTLDAAVPDHSTIWRFREALGRDGLADAVFAAINAQLEAAGHLVKRGTLIDASLMAAQAAPPPKPAAPPAAPPGEAPPSQLVRSTVDPDADWTRRGKWRLFGYKIHLAVDYSSQLVRAAILTPASVNDTVVADDLIQGDERAVYADKAYDSHARRAGLKARGIADCIMTRANKHHPLTPAQRRRNQRLGRIRGRVETAFAILKRHYGFTKARYFNLRRNATHLLLAVAAINLRRALVLTR